MGAGTEDPDVVVLDDADIPDDLPEPEVFDDGSSDTVEPDESSEPPSL